MSNKNKLLAIYKKAFKDKKLERTGLCATLKDIEGVGCNNINGTLELFEPTSKDEDDLVIENLSTAYWASGVGIYSNDRIYTFTPLRQTILAFLIAMEK